MKVSIALLSFVSLITLVISVRGETFNCQLIPFETKDGFWGTCCVFFDKNSASVQPPFPKEEVAQQILRHNSKKDDKEEATTIKSTLPNEVKEKDTNVYFQENRRHYNKRSESETPQMKNHHNTKNAKNVTIQIKEPFDVPLQCPEGQHRDHSGQCIDPF